MTLVDTNSLEVARLEDLCYCKGGETASEIERRPGERGFVYRTVTLALSWVSNLLTTLQILNLLAFIIT